METNKYVEVKDTLVTKFKFKCTQMFLRFVNRFKFYNSRRYTCSLSYLFYNFVGKEMLGKMLNVSALFISVRLKYENRMKWDEKLPT